MIDFQYYPTPSELGARLWDMFKNKTFTRVLEPSAGSGALALEHPELRHHRSLSEWDRGYGRRSADVRIDCCEIDVSRHAALRENNLTVVGLDFLQMTSGAIYSHIVMNPPFAEGAKHVLKAFDMLWDGEVAAIINAETIRNPFSMERKRLVDLIERFGHCEFVQSAFMTDETERKTSVEVALVYLRKEADIQADVLGEDLLSSLRQDTRSAEDLAAGYQEFRDVTLPTTTIENAVLIFNCAVQAMRDAVIAEARSSYYAALLGETMAAKNAEDGQSEEEAEEALKRKSQAKTRTTVSSVKAGIASGYAELKDRAWTGILKSSDVLSKLSSKAQKRLESEFETIKKLDFSVGNIYGFLAGLAQTQGQIQIEMACDVFDMITRYTSDNTVFYRGFKSNDKHRTCGMRIKTTRFIIPRISAYTHSIMFETRQMLIDIDKVFAMMDGKQMPDVGLVDIFERKFAELKSGERLSSDYFDARYYPGAQTIHFFPRSKDLMDRFNRFVGHHRAWLPPSQDKQKDGDFWKQYEMAEKMDKELRAEVKNSGARTWYDNPFQSLFCRDEEESTRAAAIIDGAAARVQERHGIDIDRQVEFNASAQQQLLLAA